MNNLFKHNIKGIGQIISCCLFLFMTGAFPSYAQTRGKLQIIKDPRIDTLLIRRMETNHSGNNGSAGQISLNGYRVQFFSSSNRAEAYSAQARFNRKYPDMRTYISYREPYFKVRAGDFRTRLEASKLLQELRPMFTSLFIIQEKINPPK